MDNSSLIKKKNGEDINLLKYIDDYVIFGTQKLVDETFKLIISILESRKEKLLCRNVVCEVHKT